MARLLQNWWIFVSERFPLGSHIPMVGLFCLGNVALTENLTAKTGLLSPSIFIITFLFFFRLRCFDEIKDYQVDLKVNPTRPLARGVLSIDQVRIMIVCILVIELALASRIGTGPLVLHMVAVAYSLLMRVEFFIGKWLSRHLTTYAVTHTFVSMLLGLSIAAQATGVVNEDMLKTLIWAAPINWALFNLFEFARKTFAPEEERPNVESYSLNFGLLGAVVLSLSQVVGALAVLWYLGLASLEGFEIQAACALIPLLAGVYLVISKSKISGKVFRAVTGAYLLLFYSLLTYQGMFL